MANEPRLLTHRLLMIDDNPAIHADYRKILAGRDDTRRSRRRKPRCSASCSRP